jgi:hypothetical protein
MRSLTIAIAISGVILTGSSCNLLVPVDCTQIGCSDALSVEIQGAASGRYRVTLLVAGTEIAVDEVDCSSPAGCRAFFEKTPSEATIRIEVPDGPVIEHAVRPSYRPMYPNGRRCDRYPVCRHGRETLRAPDAAG